MENKTLNLSLSEDQQTIVNAERRSAAAKRRREETERQIQRVRDDAAIFGKAPSADEIRLLERQLADDNELVAKLEVELREAKAAPEKRAAKDTRGAELIRHAEIIDKRIEAALESILPILQEADAPADTIVREFGVNKSGWTVLERPFTGTNIVLRLRHWNRLNVGERGDLTTFEGHHKAYRALNEPSKPVVQPKPTTFSYTRSKPLNRASRENAAVRLKLTPSGVTTETGR